MPRTGPRPHIRKYPDEVDHRLFVDCQRARAQAWYRGEEWTIAEDDYIALWRQDNRYLEKGRERHNLCLGRKDWDESWSIDNVEIVTRQEHFRRSGQEKSNHKRPRKYRAKSNVKS